MIYKKNIPRVSKEKLFSTSSCHMPWTRVRIDMEGNFSPCCSFSEKYKKNDGTPYNINQDALSEVLNSDYLNNLKKIFIKGDYPQNCQKCWQTEKIGSVSERQSNWQDNYFLGQYAIKKNRSNLLSLHIDWTNKCNLKCRICNYKASTTWGSELIKNSHVYNINASDIKNYNKKKANWDKNKIILKNLITFLSDVDLIENTGGEPLLSKSHENFLSLLTKEGLAEQISLSYNTNGTCYPQNLIEKIWPKFKAIKIKFSIDDIEKRFEYQRHPANWKEVIKNMEKFKNNNLADLKLEIYSTVSIFNILHFKELYEFVKIFKANYWHIAVLQHPDVFNIKHLPKSIKSLLANKYNKIKEYADIQKIVNELQIHNPVDKNWRQNFINKIKLTDKLRNENFSATFPEMNELLHKYY